MRFEVLVLVNVNRTVVFDVTPCSLVYVYSCFEGIYCLLLLHLRNRRVSRANNILAVKRVTSHSIHVSLFHKTSRARIRSCTVFDQYLFRIFITSILLRDRVTIDGGWTGTLTERNYSIICSSLQHALNRLSLLCVHQWMFSYSRTRVLAGWRLSHTDILLF
jgi:hypothetical protein